jgi:hypothetical protein
VVGGVSFGVCEHRFGQRPGELRLRCEFGEMVEDQFRYLGENLIGEGAGIIDGDGLPVARQHLPSLLVAGQPAMGLPETVADEDWHQQHPVAFLPPEQIGNLLFDAKRRFEVVGGNQQHGGDRVRHHFLNRRIPFCPASICRSSHTAISIPACANELR